MQHEAEPIIVTENLCKAYHIEETTVEVLKDISLTVEKGQFIVVYGPSGAGKTTLLNMISGIDKPTSGKIIVFGSNIAEQDEDFLAQYRCNQVGFVFQAYNLVSTLTVAENIAFPMEWKRVPSKEIQARVKELLQTFGMLHRADHFPSQLSGGEQQRVAFARALSNNPPLLLADEPTGNLDTKNGEKIIQILQNLKAAGKTVVVSTHDQDILPLADLKLRLDDGKLAVQP